MATLKKVSETLIKLLQERPELADVDIIDNYGRLPFKSIQEIYISSDDFKAKKSSLVLALNESYFDKNDIRNIIREDSEKEWEF